MKKLKLSRLTAIIIGVLIAVPLLILGMLTYFGVFSRASDSAPQDLLISKITTQSAVITWTTDQETQGTIVYGTAPTQLSFFAPEAVKTRTHKVELTLLTPGQTHYFVIRVGDTNYDNAGNPWTFTTKPSEEKQATPSANLSETPIATPSATGAVSPLPTQSNTSPTLTPPGAHPTLKSSTPTPTPKFACATSTDCDAILANLGPGKCSVTDYQRCRARTITPSVTPAQSPTPSSSPTPSILTPSNLNATAVSSSQIDLTWVDTSNNEDGFQVERTSANPVALDFSVIATPSAGTQQYSVTGLTGASKYYFRVRAYRIGPSYSGYTNEAQATTQ